MTLVRALHGRAAMAGVRASREVPWGSSPESGERGKEWGRGARLLGGTRREGGLLWRSSDRGSSYGFPGCRFMFMRKESRLEEGEGKREKRKEEGKEKKKRKKGKNFQTWKFSEKIKDDL
jgi:hypothetical protein